MDCNWIGLVAASRGGGEQRRRREEVLASRGGGDGGRWELGQSRRWWTVAAQGMASPMVDGGVSDGGWWTVAGEEHKKNWRLVLFRYNTEGFSGQEEGSGEVVPADCRTRTEPPALATVESDRGKRKEKLSVQITCFGSCRGAGRRRRPA
ncbi:hypothetical protein U1Q18_012017 [Sarracenia purpurea var. burkii]